LSVEHFHHVPKHGHIAKYVSGHVAEYVFGVFASTVFRFVVAVRCKWIGEIARHIASIELFGEVYTALQLKVMSPV
jgi:hypothetical protein